MLRDFLHLYNKRCYNSFPFFRFLLLHILTLRQKMFQEFPSFFPLIHELFNMQASE
jgi:hypothetical protein